MNCQLRRSIPHEAAALQLADAVVLVRICIRRRPLVTSAPLRLIVGVPTPCEL